MGNYTVVDINRINKLEETEKMITKAENLRDKFLVSLFYITGARPGELRRLLPEHITESDDRVAIKVFTSKLGKAKRFVITERVLDYKKPIPFQDIIIKYWSICKKFPGIPMLNISVRRMQQIIEVLSDRTFCPYSFRHSRGTKMSIAGAGISELMYWKGATNIGSVSPYLSAKKVPIENIE